MRLVVRSSMAAVALAAAALSYQSLMHLGELAGYGSLAILYPLVVDAGAAASCAAWLHTRGRQPLAMTWALLAVSVVLNAVEHYLQSTHTEPSWLLVVAVAAVPPSVLGLTVHLAVGMGSAPEADSPAKSFTDLSEPPSVKAFTHGRPASDVAPLPPSRGDGDRVTELLAAGAGRRKVAEALGVTEYAAKRMIAASRNGDGR